MNIKAHIRKYSQGRLSRGPAVTSSETVIEVSFAAVIRAVTLRFSSLLVGEKRCVTRLITAEKEATVKGKTKLTQ